MLNELLNYSFKDYKDIDKEEKIKDFIIKFCYESDLLDKRVAKLFSMNSWLYNYYEVEDVNKK